MKTFYNYFLLSDLEKDVDVSFCKHTSGFLEGQETTADRIRATIQKSEDWNTGRGT